MAIGAGGIERPLRVVVIGPGAVGSFLGGTLAAAGHDVTLLGRRPPDGTHGGPSGASALVLEDPDGARTTVPVRRTHELGAIPAPAPDIVIVAVKTFDLEAALAIPAARWPRSALLTAQNGVGAEEIALASADGTTPRLAASLTTAVEPLEDGVRRRRTGGIGVAVVEDAGGAGTALAARLAQAWTRGGLPGRLYPDWAAMKWSKLLANLVGNATSAILDRDPGAIYGDRGGFRVERDQLREALAVMRALGLRPVSIPGADVSLLLRGMALPAVIGRPIVSRAIASARGGKSPSLRLHVRGGGTGPTEVPWLNGAVATAGRRVGVATPVNTTLARLVEEVASDARRAAWFAGRPDRLTGEIEVLGRGRTPSPPGP